MWWKQLNTTSAFKHKQLWMNPRTYIDLKVVWWCTSSHQLLLTVMRWGKLQTVRSVIHPSKSSCVLTLAHHCVFRCCQSSTCWVWCERSEPLTGATLTLHDTLLWLFDHLASQCVQSTVQLFLFSHYPSISAPSISATCCWLPYLLSGMLVASGPVNQSPAELEWLPPTTTSHSHTHSNTHFTHGFMQHTGSYPRESKTGWHKGNRGT